MQDLYFISRSSRAGNLPGLHVGFRVGSIVVEGNLHTLWGTKVRIETPRGIMQFFGRIVYYNTCNKEPLKIALVYI